MVSAWPEPMGILKRQPLIRSVLNWHLNKSRASDDIILSDVIHSHAALRIESMPWQSIVYIAVVSGDLSLYRRGKQTEGCTDRRDGVWTKQAP